MSELQLAVPALKKLAELTQPERQRLLERGRWLDPAVVNDVSAIIAQVRENGDAALRALATRIDQVELRAIEVPPASCTAALAALEKPLREALEEAADAIRAFHRAQLPRPVRLEVRRGVRLEHYPEPLQRVGVYAPGGRAAYPSSVLMGALPARIAGVAEIVIASPAGADGKPAAAVLAAAALAEVDQLYALGGAGAVAALALGTETVRRVDKIVGPGNAYVTEAKRQLNGQVAIDGLAGPSEILIIADESADPDLIASEVCAQTEHDPDAAAVVLCTSARVLNQVVVALAGRAAAEPRRDVIRQALADNSALLLATDEEELFRFAREYAPEHLLVLARNPRSALSQIRGAGAVFLGPGSSVVFGDYITGANHVLPTGGMARAQSGLSVLDFVRWYTVQEVGTAAARELARPTLHLAEAEGLPAHATAARLRAQRDGLAEPPLILRRAYESIPLYDPLRLPCEVDLSDNTNLFGVPPTAERVLHSIPRERITRYPAVFALPLKRAIAERFGIAPENVATGCGSDDILDSAVRAFCEPGDRVVFCEPTFSMVPIFAEMNAAAAVPVPLTAELTLDLEQLVAARGRITYICRPNNPTGTAFSRYDVEALAERVPGVLLLDEAYADFGDDNFTRQAVRSERMVSMRTLSKAFGLAGLRVGIAIGPAVLIHEIEKSRGPYKVSQLAEVAAITALNQDADWIRSSIQELRRNRARLKTELERLGFRVFESGANFLLFQLPSGMLATEMAATLRDRGVAVRPFGGLPVVGECLRVTIGPWHLMERFLRELVVS